MREQQQRAQLENRSGRKFLAAELLSQSQSQKAVLLGAPGGGKTTLLSYFAVMLAQKSVSSPTSDPPDGGNDYVIAVKGNQKNLYRQLRLKTENIPPTSSYVATERTRNRVTTRTVQVFHDLTGISHEWIGLKSLIKVERTGTRAGKPYHQVAYYISSLVRNAVDFADGIRGH